MNYTHENPLGLFSFFILSGVINGVDRFLEVFVSDKWVKAGKMFDYKFFRDRR